MSTNEDLSSVIEKIIKNPEFAGMVNEIKGGGQESASDVSEEMMKKLPDVMKMVSSMFGSNETKTDKAADAVSEPNLIETKLPLSKKYDKARAEKLLYALKPYLHGGRGDIIDKCLSVMQISDIARAIGGLDGLADAIRKGGG